MRNVRLAQTIGIVAAIVLALVPGLANAQSSNWQEQEESARRALAQGDLDGAEKNWKDALKGAESASAIEPGTVTCLCGLALVNERRGNREEAERLYELAMRNMEGFVGPQSPRFADWMPDLAFLYDSHHRPDRAEVLFKKALAIKERSFGAEDPRVADVLDAYARFLRKNGRQIEAADLEQRSQTIRQKMSETKPLSESE